MMTTIQTKLMALLCFAFYMPCPIPAQNSLTYDFKFEVNTIYPPLSITKETLHNAHTILDLNPHYKPLWVKEYTSVEVLTTQKGKTVKAIGKNDTLSQEQKDLMYNADVGKGIAVIVKYLPENNLTHNEIKEFNFKFIINPDREAIYVGGQQQLEDYLTLHALDKIQATSIKQYQLAVVKFSIDEEGQVTDVHIFETSKDEKIDELLYETICNMPAWKPAEYANGLKVKQDFAFTVGDHESCTLHLLNVRRN